MQFKDLLDTQDNKLPDFSTEGLFDLGAFTNFFSGFVNKFVGIFNNAKLIPSIFAHSELQTAINLISQRSQYDLENFTVYVPEYVEGLITPYLTTLLDVLTELSTIETRILRPLEVWAASMLTEQGYADKVWVNTPTDTSKIDEFNEKLHVYFNDLTGDGVNTKTFNVTYQDADGLATAGALLDKLTALSAKVLDGKLSEKAASVSHLISQLNERKDTANSIANVPAEKLKPIIDLTIQNSKELELLAIVLFNIKTAAYANNETLAKINSQLK